MFARCKQCVRVITAALSAYNTDMKKKSEVLRSVATVTVISVVTRAISFLFKIYLSRKIGAETLGLYQTALSVFMLFAALTAGGLNTVVSRKISEMRAIDCSENGSGIVTDALKIGLTASVLCVGAVYALSPYLGYVVADERAVPLVKIMLPALVTTTLYAVLRGWFWGNKRFAVFGITELIEEILRILCALLFIYGVFAVANGAAGLAYAFTVSDFAVAIILAVLFIAKGGRLGKGCGTVEMMVHSAPITATRVFSALAGTSISLILPLKLVEGGLDITEATAAIGRISGMANPLLFAPNALIGSLAIVLVPEMSASHAKGDYESLAKSLKTGVTVAAAVSTLFAAAYLALGKEITAFLYADTASGEYLARAAVLMIPMAVNGILVSALNGIGLEKESFFTYVGGTVPMVAIVWFTAKSLGTNSVIIAESVCYVISSVGNVLILHKHAKIGFGYLKCLLKIAICAVPCYFVAKWTSGAIPSNGFWALLASGVAALSVYLGSLYVSGIEGIDKIGALLKEKLSLSKKPLRHA